MLGHMQSSLLFPSVSLKPFLTRLSLWSLSSPCPLPCPGIDHCLVSSTGLERRSVCDNFLILSLSPALGTGPRSKCSVDAVRAAREEMRLGRAPSEMTSPFHDCLHPRKVFIDRWCGRGGGIDVGERKREKDCGGIFGCFSLAHFGGRDTCFWGSLNSGEKQMSGSVETGHLVDSPEQQGTG